MKKDSQIYEDVMEELRFTSNVNEKHITISVNNGIVNLAGTVSSYVAKNSAERATRNVAGVKAVANELEVKWSEKVSYTDADIAKAATDALAWNTEIPINAIKVIVSSGNIKLIGEVNHWHQRRAAIKAVKGLRGVKGIENDIKIKQKINKSDVKKEITKALHRRAQFDSEKIHVLVDNNKVTLTGNVKSYAEFKEAAYAAWSVPGITNVSNQIKIV